MGNAGTALVILGSYAVMFGILFDNYSAVTRIVAGVAGAALLLAGLLMIAFEPTQRDRTRP